jgi:molybdopterin synthase catalytic subunit
MDVMKVTVLFFAFFRELVGTNEVEMDLGDGATLQELKVTLGNRFSELGDQWDVAVFSVNREYAKPDQVLGEGDEVAVFPPISGG